MNRLFMGTHALRPTLSFTPVHFDSTYCDIVMVYICTVK